MPGPPKVGTRQQRHAHGKTTSSPKKTSLKSKKAYKKFFFGPHRPLFCKLHLSNQNVFTTFQIIHKKRTDILWNVTIPILFGAFIYFLNYLTPLPILIQNYFADCFWAYAYSSMMLIIWNRKLNVLWLIIAFLSTVAFEVLQFEKCIAGTGDLNDVIVYAVFFGFSIFLNKYFKHLKFSKLKLHD